MPAALGVTAAGKLRQPSYRGMRTDLTPQDLVKPDEAPELPD